MLHLILAAWEVDMVKNCDQLSRRFKGENRTWSWAFSVIYQMSPSNALSSIEQALGLSW